MTVKEQLLETLDGLTPQQQAHLLTVARQLQASTPPPGTAGNVLIDALDTFDFAPGEVDVMMTTIEEI